MKETLKLELDEEEWTTVVNALNMYVSMIVSVSNNLGVEIIALKIDSLNEKLNIV